MQFVEVEHPEVGRTTVSQARVPHLAEGWKPVDGGSLEELAQPFDPSGHTIDEVTAYLDGANDAEHDRVLAAERAGKNRVGIVGS